VSLAAYRRERLPPTGPVGVAGGAFASHAVVVNSVPLPVYLAQRPVASSSALGCNSGRLTFRTPLRSIPSKMIASIEPRVRWPIGPKSHSAALSRQVARTSRGSAPVLCR
jgi:hypothetical protein